MMRLDSPANRPPLVVAAASTPTLTPRAIKVLPSSPMRQSRPPMPAQTLIAPQAPINLKSSSTNLPVGAVRSVVALPRPSGSTQALPMYNPGGTVRRNSSSVGSVTPSNSTPRASVSTPSGPAPIPQQQPPPPPLATAADGPETKKQVDKAEKLQQPSAVVPPTKMLVLPTPQRHKARDRSTSSNKQQRQRMPWRREQSRDGGSIDAPTSFGGSEAPTSMTLPCNSEPPASITVPCDNEAPTSFLLPDSSEAPTSISVQCDSEAPTSFILPSGSEAPTSIYLPRASTGTTEGRPSFITPGVASEGPPGSFEDKELSVPAKSTVAVPTEAGVDAPRRMSVTTFSTTASSTWNGPSLITDSNLSATSELSSHSLSALEASAGGNRRVSIASVGTEKSVKVMVVPPCIGAMQSISAGDVETTVGQSVSDAVTSNSSNVTPLAPEGVEGVAPTELQPQGENHEIWADWEPTNAEVKSARKSLTRCKSLSLGRKAAASASSTTPLSTSRATRPKSMSALSRSAASLRQTSATASDDEVTFRKRRSTMPVNSGKAATAMPRWRQQVRSRSPRASMPTPDSAPLSPALDSWQVARAALKGLRDATAVSQLDPYVARARSASPGYRARRAPMEEVVIGDLPNGNQQAGTAIIHPRPRRMSSRGAAPMLETSARSLISRPRSPIDSNPEARWPSPSDGIRLPCPPPLEDGLHQDGCRPHEIAGNWRGSLCIAKREEDRHTVNFSPRQLYSSRDEIRDPPPPPLEDGIHGEGCNRHEVSVEWRRSLCGQKYVDDRVLGRMVVERLNSPDPAWMTESQEIAKYFEPLGPLHAVSEGWKTSLCLSKKIEDKTNKAFSPRRLRSPNGRIRAPLPLPLEDGIERDGCRLHEIDKEFRRSLRYLAAYGVSPAPPVRNSSPSITHPREQLYLGLGGEATGQIHEQHRAARQSVVLTKQEAAVVCARISEGSSFVRTPRLQSDAASSSHSSSTAAHKHGLPTRLASAPHLGSLVGSHAVRVTADSVGRTASPQPSFAVKAHEHPLHLARSHGHVMHTARPQSPPMSARYQADRSPNRIHPAMPAAAMTSPVRKASADSHFHLSSQRRSFSTGAETAVAHVSSPLAAPRSHASPLATPRARASSLVTPRAHASPLASTRAPASPLVTTHPQASPMLTHGIQARPFTSSSGSLKPSVSVQGTLKCTGLGSHSSPSTSSNTLKMSSSGSNGTVLIWAGSSSSTSAGGSGIYRSASHSIPKTVHR